MIKPFITASQAWSVGSKSLSISGFYVFGNPFPYPGFCLSSNRKSIQIVIDFLTQIG